MIRNLLNSVSSDRSQTDDRLRKNIDDALTGPDGIDRGVFAFEDTSLPAAPAAVHGQGSGSTGAVATLSAAVAALPASAASGSTTLTVGSGSGIIFKNTFDSSCSQSYINCVVAAENAIRGQWTNSITLNLDFNAKAEGTSTFLATNTASSSVNVTYAQLKQALQSADEASPDSHAQTRHNICRPTVRPGPPIFPSRKPTRAC